MFIYIKKINNEYKINGSQDVILGNENINGDTGPWAKWSWDGEKLIAEVDRLGMHPLFYSGNRSYVAVSDSIDELINLDIPRDIDDIAVSSFLILGYFLGVDTPFESIKAFPVGGILTWDDKGLNVRENRPVYAPSLNHNKKEAIVNYVELFKKSINECVDEIDGDFELPLSGGLDSRQIFIELMNLNRFPKKTVTIELPPTRMEADHIIAKELSELYGVKNTTIPYSADPFSEEVRKNLKYDCLTDEHTWFMPLSRYMIKNNSRYLFDGIGPGDLLKGRLENGVSNGRKKDKKDLIDKIIKRYEHKKFIFNNLLSGYSKRIFTWEKGVSRITGEIESQEDEFQGFPFMFWNRTRREIALLMHMKNYKTRIFTPYLNRDLIDYLFQVNPENFKNNDFHNSAINLISGKVLPGCSRSVAFEDDEKNAEKYIRKKAIKNLVYIESYANKKYINNMWVMPRIAKGALKTNDVGYTQMIIDMVLWFSRLQNLQNKK